MAREARRKAAMLTAREEQVLTLIGKGFENTEIGPMVDLKRDALLKIIGIVFRKGRSQFAHRGCGRG